MLNSFTNAIHHLLAFLTFGILFFCFAALEICAQISVPSYRAEAQQEAVTLSLEPRVIAGQAPQSLLQARTNWAAIRGLTLEPMNSSESESSTDKTKLRIGSLRQLPQPITSLNDFSAEPMTDGTLYLLRIISPQAVAMRLHIKSLNLPDGARLFAFSRKNQQVYSIPFTKVSGEVWTSSLPGDELVIECFVPNGVSLKKDEAPFQIDAISHIFRNPRSLQGKASVEKEQPEAAASCNLPVPAEFDEAARATALIAIVKTDGEYACSGTLLSDIKKTGTPYFLTANHCISTNNEAGSAEVYWRYDSGPEPTTSPTRGAQLIVGDDVDDYSLLQLGAKPPGGVVYSGWSTNSRPVGTAVTGIHHPQADFKRASLGKIVDASCPSEIPPGFCDYYLKVRWDQGITEPGSSGSGLFAGTGNQTQLIGLLSGGASSCENQSEVDIYPRFSRMFGAFGYYLTNGEICRYSVTDRKFSYGKQGGQGSYTIVPKIGGDACPWQVQTDFSWVTLTSATNGSGLGDVSFQVAPNPSDQPRIAVISMPQIGRNAVIYQDGSPVATCVPAPVNFGQDITGNLNETSCTSGFDSSLPALRYSFMADSGQTVFFNHKRHVFGSLIRLIYPNGRVLHVENSELILLPDKGIYFVEYAMLPAPNPQPGLFTFSLEQGCRYQYTPSRFEADAWGYTVTHDKFYSTARVTQTGTSCPKLIGLADEFEVDNWGSFDHNQIVSELSIFARRNDTPKQRYTVLRVYQQPVFIKQYAKCTNASNLTFTPNQTTLPAGGGPKQVAVNQTSGLACSWNIVPYDVYPDGTTSGSYTVKMTPEASGNIAYGTGSGTINYEVAPNTTFSERKYVLRLEDQIVQNLTQEVPGKNCNRQAMQMGQTIDGSLTANDCAWITTDEQVDYYQFNGVKGEQFAVEVGVPPETLIGTEMAGDHLSWYWVLNFWNRQGTIRYPESGNAEFPSDGTYTLRVHGKPGNYQLKLLSVGPAGCTYQIDKQGEAFVSASTTNFTTNITCNRNDCDWKVQSSAEWITVPAGATGKGSQAINLALAANTGARRQATVTIAGRSFTIIQDAPCSYAKVNSGYPDKILISPQGGEYRFYVETGLNCPISISSETAWITVASPAPQVTLTAPSNTGSIRRGSVIIAGQNYAVIQGGNDVAITTAADYKQTIAPGSLVTAFYQDFTAKTEAAKTLPLPQHLGDIGVQINFPDGSFRPASLLFVSPGQINFLLPEDTPSGTATFRVYNYAATSGTFNSPLFATGEMQVEAIAPNVFTADSTGKGVAAADIQRVRAGQPDIYESVAEVRIDEQGRPVYIARPIRIGEAGEQTFLVLYATGLRKRVTNAAVTAQIGDVTVPVEYAGPQGYFVGLDQINILLPASLRGKGLVNVTITIDGKQTNPVQINLVP